MAVTSRAGGALGPVPADDSGFELLDVYDENGTRLGVKPRSLVHRDGDWHRTFSCWIIRGDADRGPGILLQRRGARKEVWPQRFDISAAGHYRAGEGIEDGARELSEELGVDVAPEALIPVGIRIGVSRYSPPRAPVLGEVGRPTATPRPIVPPVPGRAVIDREYQETFLLVDQRPLEEYRFPPLEVEGLAVLATRDGLALLDGSVEAVVVPGVAAQWSWDAQGGHGQLDGLRLALERVQYRLTAADFIPSVDQYLHKVLLLAARALRGERPLLI